MADIDVSTLESIFRMITPSDLLGAQKLTVGSSDGDQGGMVRELLDTLYNIDGHGARSVGALREKFDEIPKKGTSDAIKQYKRLLRFWSTAGPCGSLSSVQNSAVATDGATPIPSVTFDQIVGPDVGLLERGKSMGIIACNSAFLSPARRNAERVEVFMNSVPSIVASRMVPLLEVEFQFNRGVPSSQTSVPRQWSPGLIKFLMGGDASVTSDAASPTSTMIAARESHDQARGTASSLAGMEMFTSPQTLVNPSPVSNAGRYVDVLDPFRPFLSIENFVVNVTPTVGLYSYKKATLVVKLHDRSRLNEIADLVRPQLYQDRLSAPTVWITYGWRHPPEPGNPYADFINGNMLVREAYGIINSQFAFDQVGQVTITIELWTKGLSELRTVSVNTDGTLSVINDLRRLAADINTHLAALGVKPAEGTNKEIRSQLVLEAASRGAYPDMTGPEITSAIRDLKNALKGSDPKLDATMVQAIVDELGKLDRSYLDYKKQLSSQATSITNRRFSEVMSGVDPFLPSSDKDAAAAAEMDAPPHPYVKVVEAYNKSKGNAPMAQQRGTLGGAPPAFRRKIVSLGKLVSVFFANVFKQIDGFDELQLYFYQLNENAGQAAGTNLADFPIEMPVFLDQYRDHVERKGSEYVTLEEFMQLVIDAQVSDHRSVAYGFRHYYAPYDPANKSDVRLAKGISPETVELGMGRFQTPVVAVYIETTFAAVDEGASAVPSTDLLRQFEITQALNGVPNGGRSNQYARIMRVHVYDKVTNPYPLAAKLLRSDDETSFALAEDVGRMSEHARSTVTSVGSATDVWKRIIGNLTLQGQLDRNNDGALSNDEVKRHISRMVPTIVYGGNASSVINANLASKQDPLLATTQMQAMASKQGKPSVLSSNGSDVGGLPLRVIPASLTLTSLGCPLLTYAQMFFVDFNTGTTIDNVYALTGLTHTIAQGKFESQLTLTFADAYGQFFGAEKVSDYFKKAISAG